MKNLIRFALPLVFVLGLCLPSAGAEQDLRDSLRPSDIEEVRVSLNAGGAQLGFETEIPGDDSRLVALIEVIRAGEPGGDHKCPNRGSIRFQMKDGDLVGIGLLPGHEPGVYGLRLYDGDRHVATWQVERAALLGAVAALGVPTDNHAFTE